MRTHVALTQPSWCTAELQQSQNTLRYVETTHFENDYIFMIEVPFSIGINYIANRRNITSLYDCSQLGYSDSMAGSSAYSYYNWGFRDKLIEDSLSNMMNWTSDMSIFLGVLAFGGFGTGL